MDAMQYWKLMGPIETNRVCKLAGTTLDYFRHIAHGRRRPSVELAFELVLASKSVSPKTPMRSEDLLKPKAEHKRRNK